MCFDLFYRPWGYTRELENINKERPSPQSDNYQHHYWSDYWCITNGFSQIFIRFHIWPHECVDLGRQWTQGLLGRSKTRIKIPLNASKDLFSFPSKGKTSWMTCDFKEARAEYQFKLNNISRNLIFFLIAALNGNILQAHCRQDWKFDLAPCRSNYNPALSNIRI